MIITIMHVTFIKTNQIQVSFSLQEFKSYYIFSDYSGIHLEINNKQLPGKKSLEIEGNVYKATDPKINSKQTYRDFELHETKTSKTLGWY